MNGDEIMQLNEILRIKRQQMGMTQENLAKKLFVSAQSVSKWELGLSVPTIDNLVTLTDLYNLSLDELIKGSPFFKKPFLVGKKMSWKKIIIFILAWIFISLLLTGFGYQPKWLLVLILLMGIWVFPILFVAKTTGLLITILCVIIIMILKILRII